MATLMLNLLGTFDAKMDGKPLTQFDSNKARALLVYLAIESGRTHPRAKLASLFWADWDDSSALKHLRHDLSTLRRLLGDPHSENPFLLPTRYTLQFNQESDYQLDVAAFLGACQAQSPKLAQLELTSEHVESLKEGAALYKGAFLEGFRLKDSDTFNEWVLATREWLERIVLDALRRLANHFQQQSEYAQAIHYAHRCIELVPWLEDGYRNLMHLLAVDGQRSEALAQYEKCRVMLARELDVEPASETVALYQDILAGRLKGTTSLSHLGDSAQAREGDKQKTKICSSIPVPLTQFVGREEECAQIERILQRGSSRLVTLTGAGGMGKTRLSQHIAHSMLELYPDGVYFVPLVSVQDHNLVIDAIARVLDIRSTGTQSLKERTLSRLMNAQALLILDNFEHLLHAAFLVTDLLAGCPKLSVIVTSREILRVRGEYEFPIAGLSFPSGSQHESLDAPSWDNTGYSAIQLFAQYAQSVNPNFEISAHNFEDVSEICRRLDGQPLAIELAAARTKVFPPSALRRRLEESFEYTARSLLRSREKDRPERHQSLWNTLVWSYEMLNDEERFLFQRMSIFVGGCTLSAIEAICIDADMSIDALEGVTLLIEKHLVFQYEQPNGEARFAMLETIRQFGRFHLESSEEFTVIRERYACFFSTLAHALDSELKRASSTISLQLLDQEMDNLRAVMREAASSVEIEAALEISGILANYWSRRHLQIEGEQWCVHVLELAQDYPSSPAHARALFTKAFLSASQGNVGEARTFYERSLAMSREVGPNSTISLSLALLGNNAWDRGDFRQAHAYFREAQEYTHESDSGWHLAMIRTNQAACFAEQGELSEARAALNENWPLLKKVAENSSIKMARAVEARIDFLADALDIAEQKYLAICEEYADPDNPKAVVAPMSWLALVWLEKGKLQKSHSAIKDVLAIQIELGDRRGIVTSLSTLALLAHKETEVERSVVIASFVEDFCMYLGYSIPPFLQKKLGDLFADTQTKVSSEQFDEWNHRGRTMTIADAVDYAQCA